MYLAAQKEFGTVQMMDSQTADNNRVSLYLHARANNAKIIVHEPGAQHYVCLSPLPNNDLSEASESAYCAAEPRLPSRLVSRGIRRGAVCNASITGCSATYVRGRILS